MDGNSAKLLAACAAGDDDAAVEIFNKYTHRLVGLVQAQVSAVLQSRFDPQDVVQSAFGSFFRRAGNDEFTLKRSGDLWRLLAAITINKAHGRIAHELVGKRDARLEESGSVLQETLSEEPSPEAVAIVIEEVDRLMKELPPRDRCILEFRLQGASIETMEAEVAAAFEQVSQATIRRVLREVQAKLEGRLFKK